MSIEALGWAIRQPVFPSNRKFVLVLLANYASDDWLSFPSVTTISSGTGLKRETVAKAIDSLIEDGFLKDTGKRCGDTGRIKVLELSGKVPNCPPVGSIQLSGNCPVIDQQLSGNCPISGVHLIQGTGTRTGTVRTVAKAPSFTPPTSEESIAYGGTIKLSEDQCLAFMDHFLSNGWKVGKAKAPMRDWKAAMRTWKRTSSEYGSNGHPKKPSVFELELIKKAKQSKCESLKRTYAHESPMGDEWSDPDKKREYIALRRECKQIEEQVSASL